MHCLSSSVGFNKLCCGCAVYCSHKASLCIMSQGHVCGSRYNVTAIVCWYAVYVQINLSSTRSKVFQKHFLKHLEKVGVAIDLMRIDLMKGSFSDYLQVRYRRFRSVMTSFVLFRISSANGLFDS